MWIPVVIFGDSQRKRIHFAQKFVVHVPVHSIICILRPRQKCIRSNFNYNIWLRSRTIGHSIFSNILFSHKRRKENCFEELVNTFYLLHFHWKRHIKHVYCIQSTAELVYFLRTWIQTGYTLNTFYSTEAYLNKYFIILIFSNKINIERAHRSTMKVQHMILLLITSIGKRSIENQ